MAFTYTTLKTAIQDYTQNTETTFTNQLSRFIVNSEERILKECQLDVFRNNVSGNVVQDYTPNPATTGEPLYYGDWDDESFLLAPTPVDSYVSELHYFYRPTSITTASSGTSWLGDNAELALLYGALVEAYTFMKGETDLLQLYNARFQESLQWLKNLGEGRQTRDEYRYDSLRKNVA